MTAKSLDPDDITSVLSSPTSGPSKAKQPNGARRAGPAFSGKLIAQISPRNKKLVFGFYRGLDQAANQNIPPLVHSLSVLHFTETQDEWAMDPEANWNPTEKSDFYDGEWATKEDQMIRIDGNKVKAPLEVNTEVDTSRHYALLTQRPSTGIHTWTLKVIRLSDKWRGTQTQIGIVHDSLRRLRYEGIYEGCMKGCMKDV